MQPSTFTRNNNNNNSNSTTMAINERLPETIQKKPPHRLRKIPTHDNNDDTNYNDFENDDDDDDDDDRSESSVQSELTPNTAHYGTNNNNNNTNMIIDDTDSSTHTEEDHLAITSLPRLFSSTITKLPNQPVGLTLTLQSRRRRRRRSLSMLSSSDDNTKETRSTQPQQQQQQHTNSSCIVAIGSVAPTSPFHHRPLDDRTHIHALTAGDELLTVNNHRVRDPKRAAQMIKASPEGPLTLISSRGERMECMSYHLIKVHSTTKGSSGTAILKSFDTTAAAATRNGGAAGTTVEQQLLFHLGLELEITNKVLVRIKSINDHDDDDDDGGDAAMTTTISKTGLRVGDLILSIDGMAVRTVAEAARAFWRAINSNTTNNSNNNNNNNNNNTNSNTKVIAILVYSLWDMRSQVIQEELLDGSHRNWEVLWSYDQLLNIYDESTVLDGQEAVTLRIADTTVDFRLVFDRDGTCECPDPLGALRNFPDEHHHHNHHSNNHNHDGTTTHTHTHNGNDEDSCSAFSRRSAHAAIDLLYHQHIQSLADALNYRTWKMVRILARVLGASCSGNVVGGGCNVGGNVGGVGNKDVAVVAPRPSCPAPSDSTPRHGNMEKKTLDKAPKALPPSNTNNNTNTNKNINSNNNNKGLVEPPHNANPQGMFARQRTPTTITASPELNTRRQLATRIRRRSSFIASMEKIKSIYSTSEDSDSDDDSSTETTSSASDNSSSSGSSSDSSREKKSPPRQQRRGPVPVRRRLAKKKKSPMSKPPVSSSTQLVLYSPPSSNPKRRKTPNTRHHRQTTNQQHSKKAPPIKTAPSVPRVKVRHASVRELYKINPKVIGTGAFGTVRACINRHTKEQLAVKSILTKGNAKNFKLLKNEISLLQNVKHPNVVRVVDVIEDGDYIHIVMEQCRGGDLFDKLVEEEVKLGEARVCEIVASLLDAVAYLHEKNIVHRDLKAEHIMLSKNDINSTIKIIDFGLATYYNPDSDPPMTAFAGSPFTISPEVIKRKYGRECDLWSVGVITYFLLTNQMPFNAGVDGDIFQKVQSGRYAYPKWAETGISRQAKDFVSRLLVINPIDRFTAKQALNHPWIVDYQRKRGQAMKPNAIAEKGIMVMYDPKLSEKQRSQSKSRGTKPTATAQRPRQEATTRTAKERTPTKSTAMVMYDPKRSERQRSQSKPRGTKPTATAQRPRQEVTTRTTKERAPPKSTQKQAIDRRRASAA